MNTETIERPVDILIEVAPTKTTALAAVEMKTVALARFGDWRAGAAALVAKFAAVVFDCSTTKGMKEAEEARAEVRAPRYLAQRVSKNSKTELAEISRAVGAEEKEIIEALAATEAAIDAQITAEVERKAAAKLEAARLEAKRVGRHEAQVAHINGLAVAAMGKTSAQILNAVKYAEDIDLSGYEEFTAAAQAAQASTVVTLRAMAEAARTAEDAAAEVVRVQELQRIEAVRLKAEADRIHAEGVESRRVAAAQAKLVGDAQRAEAARLEAEGAKLRAELAEAKRAADEREKVAADKLRAEAAESRRVAAEQAKAAADAQRAEAAKLAAERADLDAKQKEFEAAKAEFEAAAIPVVRIETVAAPVVLVSLPSEADALAWAARLRLSRAECSAARFGVRDMLGVWLFSPDSLADMLDAHAATVIAQHVAGAAA